MLFQLSTFLSIAHATIVILISVRVIMRRPANGVALAWLFLVAVLPFVGAVVYLLVGERRVGLRRAKRIAELHNSYAMLAQRVIGRGLTDVEWERHRPEARGMDRLGTRMVGIPTVGGARVGSTRHRIKYSERLLRTSTAPARASLWSSTFGTREALPTRYWRRSFVPHSAASRAECGRRARCSPLVERPTAGAVARPGCRSDPALPVGLFQTLVSRNDLRLHRKIVVIDGKVAWTGSMNLVDPRYFKQDANVGQWVDAMVRVEGTVVVPLAMTMIGDWMLETAESIETMSKVRDLASLNRRERRMCRSSPRDPVRVMTVSCRCSLRSSTPPAKSSCLLHPISSRTIRCCERPGGRGARCAGRHDPAREGRFRAYALRQPIVLR